MEQAKNNALPQEVCVYGLGYFGLALLSHIDRTVGDEVIINAFVRDSAEAQCLSENAKHPTKFIEHSLSERINYYSDSHPAVGSSDLIVLASPSSATRSVLSDIKDSLKPNVILLNTAKALDIETGNRLSSVYKSGLESAEYEYALFAGGTIAKDLISGEPLGANIAAERLSTAEMVATFLSSPTLDLLPTDDLYGVEMASALKNVVSLVAGILHGENYSIGTETYAITRLADTIGKVCISNGANRDTFSIGSQCWGNDMWMSATGNTRNREFGILIGSGLHVDTAIDKMKQAGKTVESIATVSSLTKRPDMYEIPVIHSLHELIVAGTTSLEEFTAQLLQH